MIIFIRYGLVLLAYLSFSANGYANSIDKISNRADVQNFLVALDSVEAIALEYADIPKFKRHLHTYDIDTYIVENPITGELSKVPGDTTYFYDCESKPHYYTMRNIARDISSYPYHFFKEDIDGNGFTDLIVESEMFFIVMDMGERYQPYLFSVRPVFSFQGLIPLADGKPGLLVKHHHALGDHYEDRRYLHSNFIFITDTIINKSVIPVVMDIDTLYIIDNDTPAHPDTLIKGCFKLDTVVYRFNGFSKYNSRYKPIGISRLTYYYNQSTGYCDHYNCIEINKNRECYLKYSGTDTMFYSIIDNKHFNDIWNLVAYADVKSMENYYFNFLFDHRDGGTFSVHFDDGTIKRIDFINFAPPMSICYITQLLASFSQTLEWKPLRISGKQIYPPALSGFVNVEDQQFKCYW